MKKLVLAIATVLCLLTTVKAQTFTDEFTGMYLGSIPGIFTTSGHPYMVAVAGIGKLSVLDGDLNLLAEVENDTYIYEAYYMDADATPITISNYHNTSDHGLLLSQNLFNSDDYFEYLETQGSGDWGNATNINIKSSNGSTLYTIDADEGWFFPSSRCAFVLKIENNIYLVLREYLSTTGQEDTVKHLFYLIKKNQGLTKVDVDLPISVFPTMPTRDQQITVELGEGNNATEITVVNSLGQVVKCVPVEEGQRIVTIPAHELGSGLNVINAHSNQSQGSCKIIVR